MLTLGKQSSCSWQNGTSLTNTFFLAQVGITSTQSFDLCHDLRAPEWGFDLLGAFAPRHHGGGVTTRLPKRFDASINSISCSLKAMGMILFRFQRNRYYPFESGKTLHPCGV